MSFARKFFYFFIYSNLFIALCAVVMIYQTCRLLLHINPGIYFSGFVFFATMCSYSFHWYLTTVDIRSFSSRMIWLSRNKNVHLVFFFTGLAGAAFTGYFLLAPWQWLLLSAFITFLYSAPKIPHPFFQAFRKSALAKTIFLAFVWMYVTTILPLVVSNQPWRTEFSLFAASRGFLIYYICIIFDYRDKEYDKSSGMRSLITWLNDKRIKQLFVISLLLFGAFTCWLILFGFTNPVIILLLIPGITTAAFYRYAKKNFSDMLYYFILDGLIALSSAITLLLIAIHSK